MAGELVGLSKLKLHLLALISEARDLRERERGAREQLHHAAQKQKQMEGQYTQRLQELRAEMASRDEWIQKLETKVKYLENENVLLGNREKELKNTINGLLQSQEAFLNLYQDCTSGLRHSIELKDRKLSVLSEKIQTHTFLVDLIKKEAAAVNNLVDNIRQLVTEKEQVVSGLKSKMDKISSFEKDFVDKICFIETKLGDYQHELSRKDITILELKEHLEEEKTRSNFQPQVEEKTLLMKDEHIQSLTSEKQALHLELQNMDLFVQRIHDMFMKMNTKDRKILSSAFGGVEACEIIVMEGNESTDNVPEIQPTFNENERTGEQADMPVHQEDEIGNESCEKHRTDACQPKPSSSQSVCSDPPATADVNQAPIICNADIDTSLVHRFDSESSTTTGAKSSGGL